MVGWIFPVSKVGGWSVAPVDAERLRRRIITYATVAMIVVGVVVAALAIVPLALQLRQGALDSLQHVLTLKVMAGSEVVTRAVNLGQQVTSRTVIRQQLERYNQGAITLEALRAFTADKLADALLLSPEMVGLIRFAADGARVAELGRYQPAAGLALPLATNHPGLVQVIAGDDGPLIMVSAPIPAQGGGLAGTDIVLVDGEPLRAIVAEVEALGGGAQAAIVDVGAIARTTIASAQGFTLTPVTAALARRVATDATAEMVDDRDILTTAAPLAGTSWVMVLRLPMTEATRQVDRLLIGVAAGAAVSVGLGVLGLVRVLRPLTGVMIVHTVDMNRQVDELRGAQSELAAKTQALALSNADLQEYTYAASHDLQEPLRSIMGFAQLLERRYRGRLDPDADEFLGFIIENAERMRGQIADLLAYTGLSGDTTTMVPVALDEVAAEVMADLAATIATTGAVVRVAPLPRVRGNRDALVRLLGALLSNAIKFTRPGQPARVTVTAQIRRQWVELKVEDDGIGIAPEYQERVFRMFERLHPRGRYDGSGLGLAICRKITEIHGGRIWLKSAPDQGCAVFVLLPLAQAETV